MQQAARPDEKAFRRVLRPRSSQRDHTFQMLGLWEEVEGLDAGGLVAVIIKKAQVSHLRGRIAGNIDHAARTKLHQLRQK